MAHMTKLWQQHLGQDAKYCKSGSFEQFEKLKKNYLDFIEVSFALN